MKALTLHEPYASLIASGRKRFETRGWPPPRGLIGERIAIHAAKHRGPTVRAAIEQHYPGFRVTCPLPRATDALHAAHADGRILRFPLGRIIATARLVEASQVIEEAIDDGSAAAGFARVRSLDVPLRKWAPTDAYGDYRLGRWLWWLEGVRLLPTPRWATGRQGLWDCAIEE